VGTQDWGKAVRRLVDVAVHCVPEQFPVAVCSVPAFVPEQIVSLNRHRLLTRLDSNQGEVGSRQRAMPVNAQELLVAGRVAHNDPVSLLWESADHGIRGR
jgi:hypothetical protein